MIKFKLNSSFAAFVIAASAFTTSLSAANTTTVKNHETKQTVRKAVAVLHATEGSKVEGTVTFTQENGGVKIVADVKNLTPGKHGFHVHEHGDCSAHDGMSAGGHFNPTNTKHGGPDSPERHVGDLGNLEANANGVAHYERIDKIISLNGQDTIVGRSIVVHADEDDLHTQPTGNSGARIACGVIEEQK